MPTSYSRGGSKLPDGVTLPEPAPGPVPQLAVSAEAAGPYRARLLRLPAFLTPDDGVPGAKDLVDGLALTGFFLERTALEPHGAPLPGARMRLSERLAGFAADR